MTAPAVDCGRIASVFISAFPAMGAHDQRLALGLYRLLGAGSPVAPSQLAGVLGRALSEVEEVLAGFPGVFRDAGGDITGFWGLGLGDTRHRLQFEDGPVLYAWCAWDTLFLPALLGRRAFVTSTCPVSGSEIRLMVGPEGIESADPVDAALSFLVPDEERLRKELTTSFCRFVHFFRSRSEGEAWIAERPGMFLLTLVEGQSIGARLNAARYGVVLDVADR